MIHLFYTPFFKSEDVDGVDETRDFLGGWVSHVFETIKLNEHHIKIKFRIIPNIQISSLDAFTLFLHVVVEGLGSKLAISI
jgi:hypothetical protein